MESYKLYNGNMLEVLESMEANSIDSIVTDPPYELNFMNKGWDNAGVSFNKTTWEKCFKVLKPRWLFIGFWWYQNLSPYSLCDRGRWF